MVASLNPYLSFNGTCEAAFDFYKSVFGGEFDEFHRYKDIPGEEEIPESEREKVLHISLRLTEHVWLMGADTSEVFGQTTRFGDCVTLTICTTSEEETHRIYKELSKDGIIIVALEKTYWADLYATFTDKFGITWALNFMKEE